MLQNINITIYNFSSSRNRNFVTIRNLHNAAIRFFISNYMFQIKQMRFYASRKMNIHFSA